MVRTQSAGAVQGAIRSRVITWFIGLTLIMVMAVGGCSQGARTDGGPALEDESAIRETQDIAAMAASLVNVYMDARVTDMLVCSAICDRLREGLTSPGARADANRALEAWLKASGAYDAILLLDKTGVCVASAPEGFVNEDFSNDEAFKGAVKGKLTISDFHQSPVLTSLDPKSKGWTLAIAVPLKVGKDVEGVFVSYLKWKRLEELVFRIKVGRTGYVFVLNSKNQVIVHPAQQLHGVGVRDPQINLPQLDAAIRQKAPHFSYQFKNRKTDKMDTKISGFTYLQGYGNFPGLGWVVGAGADRSEIGELPFLMRLFRLK